MTQKSQPRFSKTDGRMDVRTDPMTMEPSLDVDRVGDVAVLRLTATKFDSASFEALTRKLYRLIDRKNCRKVVVNLQGVEYLFSESVGLLLGLEKRIARSNCELRLCGLSPNARETLEIAQLQHLFEIHDDETAALDGF